MRVGIGSITWQGIAEEVTVLLYVGPGVIRVGIGNKLPVIGVIPDIYIMRLVVFWIRTCYYALYSKLDGIIISRDSVIENYTGTATNINSIVGAAGRLPDYVVIDLYPTSPYMSAGWTVRIHGPDFDIL